MLISQKLKAFPAARGSLRMWFYEDHLAIGNRLQNKLHSLGVRFSLAVSGRNWQTALETGREIIKDFPNSKMAEEIRERIDTLEQKT